MPANVTIDQSALDSVLGRLIVPWLEQLTEDVATESRSNAPRGQGDGPHLADNIVTRIEGTGTKARGVIVANVPHALSVHEGARAHQITPRVARVLRFPASDGRIVFAPRVSHPGNQPNPFLRNALVRVVGSR